MTRELFFETVGWILIVALVIGLVVIGVVWMRRGFQKEAEGHCVDLGERLGYETELLGGYCYIKVRPGLKVREDRVLDFLPVIDCR